jgi:hypothetical protein
MRVALECFDDPRDTGFSRVDSGTEICTHFASASHVEVELRIVGVIAFDILISDHEAHALAHSPDPYFRVVALPVAELR